MSVSVCTGTVGCSVCSSCRVELKESAEGVVVGRFLSLSCTSGTRPEQRRHSFFNKNGPKVVAIVKKKQIHATNKRPSTLD